MDIAFAQNYQNYYEIDITPDADAPTWARIGAGINSAEPNGNETVSQDPYYDCEGASSSEVTGGQLVLSFSGHRVVGDEAQDFIAGLQLAYGSSRKTRARWTSPDGDRIEGPVTVANIAVQGGDPNAKSDFSFELHFNGRPTFVAGNAREFPTSIDVTPVSVAVGGTAQVGATVAPSTANYALSYAVDDRDVATVGSDGTVTGVAAGETELTVKSCVLPSLAATMSVTVTEETDGGGDEGTGE